MLVTFISYEQLLLEVESQTSSQICMTNGTLENSVSFTVTPGRLEKDNSLDL
jgi:hypothetical protein